MELLESELFVLDWNTGVGSGLGSDRLNSRDRTGSGLWTDPPPSGTRPVPSQGVQTVTTPPTFPFSTEVVGQAPPSLVPSLEEGVRFVTRTGVGTGVGFGWTLNGGHERTWSEALYLVECPFVTFYGGYSNDSGSRWSRTAPCHAHTLLKDLHRPVTR